MFHRFLLVLGVFTEPDRLPIPNWIGWIGQYGPVFKTMGST